MRQLSVQPFKRLQQLWDIPDAWKKWHPSTRMARRRKYRLVSLTSALWEYPPKAISKHIKVKNVTDNSQRGFTNVEDNLIDFYDELIAFVD